MREALFKAALDQVCEAVYLLDEQGAIHYANHEAARMLGYEREALLRMRLWDLDPEIPMAQRQMYWEALVEQGVRRFETSHRRSDGQQVPVEVASSCIHHNDTPYRLALVRDISERKRAEHDIGLRMESQRQLIALIESHPDVVARYDCAGRFVYLSPRSVQRFGGTLAQRIGKTMAEVNPRYGPPMHESIRRVAESGLPRQLELPYPVHDELRHWEVRHVPEVGEHGRVTGVLGIARDITVARQAEQTIAELHQRREAAREEERRHIARELHDEMGQYLSALRMEVSVLRMRWGGLDPALQEKAEGLQRMVDRVIQVMRHVVSSLRPPVLDMGIASALEWLVEEFRGPSGVACHLTVDESSVALDAQQTVMVFRIVQESMNNVARHAQARRVDVTFARRGANYLLMVRDDGCGFDPEDRPVRSLGLLGLQERATALGGLLDIRSRPGAGTTVCVTFPSERANSRS
ncbi:PAS domain-containing sensor histidine kinase [Aquabacterium sp.]|uniref:PAS domain-containing sensor histidine kinase n=1 Tax=Aquabacterium sp. TaxID=1872578 RepID=UPI002C053619|nr:PAS domain S-box protein [Aquabacterium sp.]HSW03977.1 PAS domain S-box protein [Aquabacterium sp.]